MSTIQLTNVSLDYIVKNGSISIKKATLQHLKSLLYKDTIKKNSNKNTLFRALNNVNLNIELGDKIGILGRNGSGKSTLLRVLARIYKPNFGALLVKGAVSNLFDVTLGLNPDANGYENIMILGVLRGIPKKHINDLISDVESFTELGSFLNKPVRTYSTGMRMKLAFAVATAKESEIVLIDEVIGAGDTFFMDKATLRLNNMIENSHILVLTSHSNDIIRRFCNKVLVLDHGEVQYFGDMETGIDWYKDFNLNTDVYKYEELL